MKKLIDIPPAERDANGVNAWCNLNGVSRTYFYELLKQGKGPRLMRVGRRFLISKEASADWRREMEAATQPLFKHVDLDKVR